MDFYLGLEILFFWTQRVRFKRILLTTIMRALRNAREKDLAISGFPNHKISYDIRPVWNLHNFWPVQIHSEICTLSFNAINCACNQQKNQPVLRRA